MFHGSSFGISHYTCVSVGKHSTVSYGTWGRHDDGNYFWLFFKFFFYLRLFLFVGWSELRTITCSGPLEYVGKKRRLHIPMPDRSSYDKIGRFFPTLVPRDVLSTAALLLNQKSAKKCKKRKKKMICRMSSCAIQVFLG